MAIVPFMLEWMVQWNGYEPAALKTRLCGASPVMFADIVHEPSSRPTLCGMESPLVHVMTSPTAALTGPQVLPWTDACTSAAVPAAGSVQTAVPVPDVPGGFVVVPPEQCRSLHLVRGAPR